MDGFVLVGGPVVTVVACAGVYGPLVLFHNIFKFLLETCLKALGMRDSSACDGLRLKPDVSGRCMREWGPGVLARCVPHNSRLPLRHSLASHHCAFTCSGK